MATSLQMAPKLQVNLGIALSGVSAKVRPFQPVLGGRKCVETSDDVIKNLICDPSILSSDFSSSGFARDCRQCQVCSASEKV
jgi:hypothetical protein